MCSWLAERSNLLDLREVVRKVRPGLLKPYHRTGRTGKFKLKFRRLSKFSLTCEETKPSFQSLCSWGRTDHRHRQPSLSPTLEPEFFLCCLLFLGCSSSSCCSGWSACSCCCRRRWWWLARPPGRQQACWTSLWWCKQWTCWQELPPVNVKPPGGVAWELVRARVLHLGEVERIRHIQRKFKLSPHIGLALCRSESFPLSAMNIQYEIFQHYVLAQRKKGRAQKLMKFRPLVRKLPRAPLDQLLPQETPGPPKTEDWGKVKVRRGFPHIKSEQESESEEKLSSHSMRLVILKLKKGKPAQRVLYFSAWSVVGSVSQCWFGQMLRVGTRPEHVF